MLFLPRYRGLTAGALGGAFDPATLALHLWLDPSDLATLFQDSAHTTAVTADADPVGAIFNKGSVADYFIQATAGARPLYKVTGALKGVWFDGVDDVLAGSALSNFVGANGIGDFVCAGIMPTVATGSANPYDNDPAWADGGGFKGLHFHSTGPKMQGFNWDGSADVAEDAYTAGDPFVAHTRHTGVSGNLSLTLNARSTVTVASSGTTTLTGLVRLANRNVAQPFSDLKLYGLIARKTVLDATELANVKTYLGAKVGLVL